MREMPVVQRLRKSKKCPPRGCSGAPFLLIRWSHGRRKTQHFECQWLAAILS